MFKLVEIVEADTTVESDSNSTVCFSSDDGESSNGDIFPEEISDSDDNDNDNNNNNNNSNSNNNNNNNHQNSMYVCVYVVVCVIVF